MRNYKWCVYKAASDFVSKKLKLFLNCMYKVYTAAFGHNNTLFLALDVDLPGLYLTSQKYYSYATNINIFTPLKSKFYYFKNEHRWNQKPLKNVQQKLKANFDLKQILIFSVPNLEVVYFLLSYRTNLAHMLTQW